VPACGAYTHGLATSCRPRLTHRTFSISPGGYLCFLVTRAAWFHSSATDPSRRCFGHVGRRLLGPVVWHRDGQQQRPPVPFGWRSGRAFCGVPLDIYLRPPVGNGFCIPPDWHPKWSWHPHVATGRLPQSEAVIPASARASFKTNVEVWTLSHPSTCSVCVMRLNHRTDSEDRYIFRV